MDRDERGTAEAFPFEGELGFKILDRYFGSSNRSEKDLFPTLISFPVLGDKTKDISFFNKK
jgi:hypothetical protein